MRWLCAIVLLNTPSIILGQNRTDSLSVSSQPVTAVTPSALQPEAPVRVHVRQPSSTSAGGVRIYSRRDNRRRIIIRRPPVAPVDERRLSPSQPVEGASGPSASALPRGLTQADLDRLEDRIVSRLFRLLDMTVVAPAPTVVSISGAPGVTTTPSAQPIDSVRQGEPTAPLQPPPVARRPEPSAIPIRPRVPTIEEVERALLDTGIFRTLAVHFEVDRSTPLESSTPTLEAVADVLRRYPTLRVQIAGHTDSTGPDAYNQRLSDGRAEAVRQALVERGVGAGQLSAVGYGESSPIASNANATGRTINRRVEFVVLNPDEAVIESRRVLEAE